MIQDLRMMLQIAGEIPAKNWLGALAAAVAGYLLVVVMILTAA